MCAFISLLYLWLFFTYIPVISFPKIIPSEKCFAFVQGVWNLFFLSFEIQFAYNLLRFLISCIKKTAGPAYGQQIFLITIFNNHNNIVYYR
jgi:hypothetical protein